MLAVDGLADVEQVRAFHGIARFLLMFKVSETQGATMKRAVFLSGLVWIGLSGAAIAACGPPANKVTGTGINTLLNGSLVCGRPGANYPGDPNDRWQEQHASIGAGNGSANFSDYKKGPADPVDPTVVMGTWSRDPSNNVTYSYTRFTPNFTVSYDGIFLISGNTYSFCEGALERARANVINPDPGNGCGGVFPP